jgi:hypothetical protein
LPLSISISRTETEQVTPDLADVTDDSDGLVESVMLDPWASSYAIW